MSTIVSLIALILLPATLVLILRGLTMLTTYLYEKRIAAAAAAVVNVYADAADKEWMATITPEDDMPATYDEKEDMPYRQEEMDDFAAIMMEDEMGWPKRNDTAPSAASTWAIRTATVGYRLTPNVSAASTGSPRNYHASNGRPNSGK